MALELGSHPEGRAAASAPPSALHESSARRFPHLAELGELMNLCHGYLNALQLSTPELEELIHISRTNGALGAKLTGGGGGGAIVALCPDCQDQVAGAMESAGYKALMVTIRS